MQRATGWAGGLEFRVLGPIEARVDGVTVDVGGARQRRLVAVLLANANEVVSSDALIDRVWDDAEMPSEPQKAIRTYVSRLRKSLSRAGVPPDQVLVTDPPGYRLALSEHQIDSVRFEQLITSGRSTLAGDPAAALEALDAAAAMWRGDPFLEFADRPWAEPEAVRLAELRAVALEDRAAARLEMGAHAEVVADLEQLHQADPLRARPVELLMTALFRSDRHPDALRVAESYRRDLVEVGLEPSAGFGELESRIAAGDASLLVVEARTQSLRGYELAEQIGEGAFSIVYRGVQPSVGREVAIKRIRAELANRPEFIRRFEAEAHLVASLEHPHIVPLYDYWREPGAAYLVMRWLRGGTLESQLLDHRLDREQAGKLAVQVGAALATAHEAGVVHRDVKSPNIFLDGVGNYYLGDFGIAVEAASRHDPEALLSVGSPAYASPEQLRREAVGPASDVHSLGVVLYEALAGQLPFPDERTQARLLQRQLNDPIPSIGELRPDIPLPVDDILQRATAKHVSNRIPSVELLVSQFTEALNGAPKPASTVPTAGRVTTIGVAANPYKGLRAFQESDADDFCGRDRLVDRLVQQLQTSGPSGRLIAAVGPSGSGKSSVVRAGVIPRVRAGAVAGSSDWFVTTMVPGVDPFEELEAALSRVATAPTTGLVETMRSDERGIARAIKAVLPDEGSELLLVLDQFEELFTLVVDHHVRQRFIECLVAAVTDARSRLRVVATIRADFWDGPLRYPELARILETSAVTVTPLAADELERAIVDPALRAGVELEPGLASVIVADVRDQPGALPLLQYALTELFDRRSSGLMQLDEYRELGGVAGALARRAEQLYQFSPPQDQAAVRHLFTRLVTPGEGVEDTRRRVVRSEMSSIPENVIQRFGDARLLTFDRDPATREPTVEVAHEALLKEWARLRDWIDDQREQLVLRKRLDTARREWESSDRDTAFLLAGRRLGQFGGWASSDLALSDPEREFLDLSRDHEDAIARRASTRRRRVMTALAAAAVIAVAFGVVALIQQQKASDQAFDAETARLGNEAGFVSEWNRQLSLLMAVETFRRDPGFEGLSSLQRVLVDAGTFLGVLGAENDYRDVRWLGPDRLIAATDGEVHLIDLSSSQVSVLPIELEPARLVNDSLGPTRAIAAASPSGLAAVVDVNGQLVLVDGRTGSVDRFPAGDDGRTFAISDDGTQVAVGHSDGLLRMFERATGTMTSESLVIPVSDTVELGGIAHLAFDDGDRRIVAVGGPLMRVLSTDDLRPEGPEITNSWLGIDAKGVGAPDAVWIDKEDADVVVAAGDRFATRWRISTGDRVSIAALPIVDSGVESGVVQSAGLGSEVIVLHSTGRVVRGSLAQALPPETPADLVSALALDAAPSSGELVFDSQQNGVRSLAVDEAQGRLAVASSGGVILASLDGTRLAARSVPIGSSVSPTLTRDGQTLAAGVVDDGVFDLTLDPPTQIDFLDVGVEIAQFAGSPPTLEFTSAAHADIVLWATEFQSMRNGYDFATGDYEGDFWGAFVPAWNEEGTRIARSTRQGETLVEDLETDTVLYQSSASMTSADLDGAGARALLVFANGPADTTPAALVDLATGSSVPLPAPPGGVVSAAFTPAETEIVIVGRGGDILVVDADDLAPKRELQGADVATTAFVAPPVFSADGRWMFSASDGVARLWEYESGRQVGKPFPSQAGGRPWGIDDTDRLRLVTPVDGYALVWNVEMDTWSELACRAAGRNMTEAEWDTFGPNDMGYRATCPAS